MSLSGLTSPTLIFWIYGFAADAGDLNVTTVSVICDGQEVIVDEFVHTGLTPDRWNRMETDLSDYAGKDVRVKLSLACNGVQYTLYDNIYIGDNIQRDLSVALSGRPKWLPEPNSTSTPQSRMSEL